MVLHWCNIDVTLLYEQSRRRRKQCTARSYYDGTSNHTPCPTNRDSGCPAPALLSAHSVYSSCLFSLALLLVLLALPLKLILPRRHISLRSCSLHCPHAAASSSNMAQLPPAPAPAASTSFIAYDLRDGSNANASLAPPNIVELPTSALISHLQQEVFASNARALFPERYSYLHGPRRLPARQHGLDGSLHCCQALRIPLCGMLPAPDLRRIVS